MSGKQTGEVEADGGVGGGMDGGVDVDVDVPMEHLLPEMSECASQATTTRETNPGHTRTSTRSAETGLLAISTATRLHGHCLVLEPKLWQPGSCTGQR